MRIMKRRNNSKLIIIVPDGMADERIPDLGNKTPLEVARKPNIDFIFKNGITGVVKNIPDNLEPGSDVANFSILGVNSASNKIGRGILEAFAKDIKINNNEYVFRANFVTIKNDLMIDYSGGNIDNNEAKKIIEQLNKYINSFVRFYSGVGYRNLAVIKYKNRIDIKTVPPHDIIGKDIKDYLPKGKDSKIIIDIMFRTKDIIAKLRKKSSANMLWLWGEGSKPKNLKSFYDNYKLKGAVISAVDIIKGIAKLLKMDVIKVPGITGDYKTNYKNKALFAIKNLNKYDVIYIHIEAPDEASHHGNYIEKIKAIEKIDKMIVGEILKSKKDLSILLLPDHITSCLKRTHIKKPVPFIFYSPKIKPNHNFEKFSEAILENPPLFIENGHKLLKNFIKLIF